MQLLHMLFLMTVSAAMKWHLAMFTKLWLLRHAQHARYINIHKLQPFLKKIGLGSADFLHSGTGYIEIAVFVPRRFQSRFSAQWNTQNNLLVKLSVPPVQSDAPKYLDYGKTQHDFNALCAKQITDSTSGRSNFLHRFHKNFHYPMQTCLIQT